MHRTLFGTLCLIGFGASAASADVTPSFVAFGAESSVYGISADGSSVITIRDPLLPTSHASRWRRATGFQDLGVLPGFSMHSEPAGISADGEVITGSSWNAVGARGFRWTPSGGMKSIGALLPYFPYSIPFSMSNDGNTIVGNASEPNGGTVGFRWTPATQMSEFTPGLARVISGDSNYIAGPKGRAGYRWSQATGLIEIPLPANAFSITVKDISDDGSIVVGNAELLTRVFRPFRWTVQGGLEYLPLLPGGSSGSITSISADGSLMLGASQTPDGFRAVVWGAAGSPRMLQEILGDIVPPGFSIGTEAWVAADGSTFAGTGYHDGHLEGWHAVVPTPATPLVVAAIMLPTIRRRRRACSFWPPTESPTSIKP